MSNDFLIQFEKAVKKFKSEIRDQRLNPYNFRLFESFRIDEMTLSSLIRRAIHLIEESSASSFLDLISKKTSEVIANKNRKLNRSWAEYQIKDKRRIDLLFE